MKPKFKKSTVVAAAIAAMFLFSGATFAAVTIWNQQQAELRNILNVEGKDIPEYVEYTPANTEPANKNVLGETDLEPTAKRSLTVNVLSSLKESQFVNYYISVSPLTLEQVKNYDWYYQREGIDGRRFVEPVIKTPVDGSPVAITDVIETAYDESTRSLFLKIPMMLGYDIDLDETEPISITLLRGDRNMLIAAEAADPELRKPMRLSQKRELVPDAFNAAEFIIIPNTIDMSVISISFGDGIKFENPETGETGLILGAEVNAVSFVWIHSYPGADKHYAARAAGEASYLSEEAAWLNGFENAIRDAVVLMSDGSIINAPIPVAADIVDGVIKSHGRFVFPIELSALEDVIVCTDEAHDHNQGWNEPKG